MKDDLVGQGLYFQQDVNKKLTCACVFLSLSLTVSLGLNVVEICREVKPVYFGMNQEMQILPMYPLAEPMHTDAALTSWAAQAATAVFNLDFLHFREQLADLRKYFTKSAYVSFSKTLKDEGHLTILAQYRALMHGVVQGMPIIVAKGVLQNRVTWEVEIPLQLAYETSEKVLANHKYVLTMRIQRMSTAEYVQGIAISQLVVRKMRG